MSSLIQTFKPFLLSDSFADSANDSGHLGLAIFHDKINEALGGGLVPGSLTILIGGTGQGKSQIALSSNLYAAGIGYNTLYVSTEMQPSIVNSRILAYITGQTNTMFDKVIKANPTNPEQVDKEKARIANVNKFMVILEKSLPPTSEDEKVYNYLMQGYNFAQPLTQIINKFQLISKGFMPLYSNEMKEIFQIANDYNTHLKNKGEMLNLIVVDHPDFLKLGTEDEKEQKSNQFIQDGKFISELKAFCEKTNAAAIVVKQLTSKSSKFNSNDIRIDNIRGNSDWQYVASTVFAFDEDVEQQEQNKTRKTIEKNITIKLLKMRVSNGITLKQGDTHEGQIIRTPIKVYTNQFTMDFNPSNGHLKNCQIKIEKKENRK